MVPQDSARALFYARRNPEAVKVLLEFKADVNLIAREGDEFMIIDYSSRCTVACMQLILDAKADPNQKSHEDTLDRGTPLIVASRYGNVEVVKLLLERKADVNHADSEGMAALMHAVRYLEVETAKILIEHRADIHALSGEDEDEKSTVFDHALCSSTWMGNKPFPNDDTKEILAILEEASTWPCYQQEKSENDEDSDVIEVVEQPRKRQKRSKR